MAAPVPRLSPDRRLARRVFAGDRGAWDAVDARYRPRLTRYVAGLARPGALDVDDVVQDALVKAYTALAGGRAPAERLGPWLYRIARNTAIDALRASARQPVVEVDAGAPPDRRADPERVVLGRQRLRGVVEDVAALPERQRTAFLARVVDGRSVDDVAAELGVSPNAVHMTVARARERLARTERARDTDCLEVRPLLLDAHERGARPPESARLHLRGCAGCRAYRADLRRVDRRARGLLPPLGGLLGLAGVLAPAGAGVKGAVVVGVGVTALVAGGLVVGEVHESDAGTPAPFRIPGAKTFGPSRVRAGDAVPRRTTLVHARVTVPSSADERHPRYLVLRCPAGTIVAGLASPEEGTDVEWNPHPAILDRRDTAVRFRMARMGRSSNGIATIGVVCRRPDANGSTFGRPRQARAGERPAHACDLGTTAQRRARGLSVENVLYPHAGGRGFPRGRLVDGQPVSVVRSSPGGRWLYAIADDPAERGWIDARYVC